MPASNAPRSAKADAEELLKLFPGALGPWKLKELGQPLPPQVPAPKRLVRAVYVQDRHSAEISVRAGPAGSAGKGARDVYRESPPQRPDTLVVVSLGNGVSIAATSATADAAALEALIRAIDLDRAESLVPVKR